MILQTARSISHITLDYCVLITVVGARGGEVSEPRSELSGL